MVPHPLLRRPRDRMGHPRALAGPMVMAMTLARVPIRRLMNLLTRHEVRTVAFVESIRLAG